VAIFHQPIKDTRGEGNVSTAVFIDFVCLLFRLEGEFAFEIIKNWNTI
jgi:hypothetical protein